MKPLILGVGNILLSDEGVGVRVVQELEKRPEIQPHFVENVLNIHAPIRAGPVLI